MAYKTDLTFEKFNLACLEQGVQLRDDLVKAGYFHINNRNGCGDYTPTGILSAVHKAGYLLGQEPTQRLGSGPINSSPDLQETTPSRTLLDMVNASIAPAEPQPGEVHFISRVAEGRATCSYADYAFMITASSLNRIRGKNGAVRYGCQIITKSDQPVILRKGLGERTGLTLKDININGIPYPVGSIVALELRDEEGAPNPLEPPRDHIETITTGFIDRISFLRLSAFALSPKERQDSKFEVHINAYASEAKLFSRATIDDFTIAAEDALERLAKIDQIKIPLGVTAAKQSLSPTTG